MRDGLAKKNGNEMSFEYNENEWELNRDLFKK